jgi:hypothetical protein
VDDGSHQGIKSCTCPSISDSDCKPIIIKTGCTDCGGGPGGGVINSGDVGTFTWQITEPTPASVGLSCTLTGYNISTTCTGSACNSLKSVTTPPLTASSVYTINCKNGSVVNATKSVRFTLNPIIRER